MDSQVLAIREELKREAASSGDMLLRVAGAAGRESAVPMGCIGAQQSDSRGVASSCPFELGSPGVQCAGAAARRGSAAHLTALPTPVCLPTRTAERWRSAPLVERQLYKRQAMEERWVG